MLQSDIDCIDYAFKSFRVASVENGTITRLQLLEFSYLRGKLHRTKGARRTQQAMGILRDHISAGRSLNQFGSELIANRLHFYHEFSDYPGRRAPQFAFEQSQHTLIHD